MRVIESSPIKQTFQTEQQFASRAILFATVYVLFLSCFVLRFGDLTKLLQKGIGFSFTVAMMPEGWNHVTFQRLPTNLTTSLESQELCDVATVCVQSCEPCSKCLTSWHQIRKCLRQCLRFAYARTSFAYAHILSYADLTLAYAHHSFAYATPLQGAPCLT